MGLYVVSRSWDKAYNYADGKKNTQKQLRVVLQCTPHRCHVHDIPSGKHTKTDGKITTFNGRIHYFNGHFP